VEYAAVNVKIKFWALDNTEVALISVFCASRVGSADTSPLDARKARLSRLRYLLLAFIFLFALPSFAQTTEASSYTFTSAAQQQQFTTMTEQLRCLVCQNESLWDSHAPLAKDLRTEIYNKIKQGESEDAIKEYLVARYGQFILFKPALTSATYILWVMPFILLLCAFFIVGFIVFRSKRVKK